MSSVPINTPILNCDPFCYAQYITSDFNHITAAADCREHLIPLGTVHALATCHCKHSKLQSVWMYMPIQEFTINYGMCKTERVNTQTYRQSNYWTDAIVNIWEINWQTHVWWPQANTISHLLNKQAVSHYIIVLLINNFCIYAKINNLLHLFRLYNIYLLRNMHK
jgi:hypothetical protein